MKLVSRIILLLLIPLILLSGNGLFLLQHHCKSEGETSYSLAGLVNTSDCCDPVLAFSNSQRSEKSEISDPDAKCCSIHSLFFQTAQYNQTTAPIQSETGFVAAALTTDTSGIQLNDQGRDILPVYQYGAPPGNHPDLAFLGVYRL
jgi:hypothetical protein